MMWQTSLENSLIKGEFTFGYCLYSFEIRVMRIDQ